MKINFNFTDKTAFSAQLAVEDKNKYASEYNKFLERSMSNRRAGYMSYEVFNANVDTFVSRFKSEGVTTPMLLKAAVKTPLMLFTKPKTLISNVNETVGRFSKEGLTMRAYLKACLKQPSVLLMKPDTIEHNIRGLVNLYAKDGLTTEDYLKIALNQPSLFAQTPDGVSKNINKFVTRFSKSGINSETYIKLLKRVPALASIKPETAEKNITDIVKKYSKYGLTEEKYARIVSMYPTCMTTNAKNKIKHISNFVKMFKSSGLTEEICIKTFMRQPALFSSNLLRTSANLNLLLFIEREKYKDAHKRVPAASKILEAALNKNLGYSTQFNYLFLLRNKLMQQHNKSITWKNLKSNMESYIKQNKDSVVSLEISKSPYTEDFIKFIDKYSREITGKNIFKFIIR